MNRTAILLSLLSFGALSATAHAADPVIAPPPAPAPAPVETGPSWSGFYIGVHTGAAMGNLGYTTPIADYDFADTFWVGGVHAGYDRQFAPRWVGGVEIDWTWLGSEYVPFEGQSEIFKADWQASATARLGYLVTPETLFYGRLGIAGIDSEAPEGFFDTASETVTAFKIGVGAETFVTRRVTARVEANYLLPTSDFETRDRVAYDPRQFLVTAGLSYRFGAGNGSTHTRVPAPANDWQGLYVGLTAGYGFASMENDLDIPLADVGPFGSESVGLGGFVGYNFRLGDSWVAGAEVEALWHDHDFHDPAGNALADPTTNFATVNGSLAGTIRVGRLFTPSTLVYVKGGIAGLVTEAHEEFYPFDGGGKETLPAYQVGFGIESALTERATLRVEGVYTAAYESLTTINAQRVQIDLTPSLLTGKVGLAWHF